MRIYLLYNIFTRDLGSPAQAATLLEKQTKHAATELRKAGIDAVPIVNYIGKGKTYSFFERGPLRADGAQLSVVENGIKAVFADGKAMVIPVKSAAQVVPIYIANYDDTGNPAQGTHGYADFFDAANLQNGIYLSAKVIPGSANADPRYNEGDVLVHELGHFLGDLPHDKQPYRACQADGEPNRNIMDYAPDACRAGYSAEQAQIIRTMMQRRMSAAPQIKRYSPVQNFLMQPPKWIVVVLAAAAIGALAVSIYCYKNHV